MLTRREFIGAGIGVAAATQALALTGDKMRYAMSEHQFRGLKPHPETGIKMTARYGYHGIEPFQDDMPQYLKQPPEVFKKLLDDAGVPGPRDRAGSRRRSLVDADDASTTPRQLEGDGGADAPRADDDGVGVGRGHRPSFARLNRCHERHVSRPWLHAPNQAEEGGA